jgi:hypothetical protein
LTKLRGQVIGSADLTACRTYRTPVAFAADTARHRNEPEWFQPPVMYGFEFRDPTMVPPFVCTGSVRFFRIDVPEAA